MRISSSSKMRAYIAYALTLLQEKGHRSVTLSALGRAITKAVTVGECC